MEPDKPITQPILQAIKDNDIVRLTDLLFTRNLCPDKLYPYSQANINRLFLLAVYLTDNDDTYSIMKEVVLFLIEKGADIEVFDDCRNIKMAKLLLKYGANINKINDWTANSDYLTFGPDTFLHNVVCIGDINLIKFALENGADVNLKNNLEKTPLEDLNDTISQLEVYFPKSPSISCLLDLKAEIQPLFTPYLVNSNQKLACLKILKNCPKIDKVDITKFTKQGCERCIKWVNKILSLENQYLTKNYKKKLTHLANQLINQLYPGLIYVIDQITDDKNFILVKTALLSKENCFGLDQALNYVVQLYESDLLTQSLAEKIKILRDKMEEFYGRYQVEPQLSVKTINEIKQFVEPLHQALLSFGRDYQKTSYKWYCRRVKKIIDIEDFPTKNKITKINKSMDWLTLSFASAKNTNGEIKSIIELHKAKQKKEFSAGTVNDYAEARFNI